MKEAETLSLSREAWGCLQRKGKQLVRLESHSSPHFLPSSQGSLILTGLWALAQLKLTGKWVIFWGKDAGFLHSYLEHKWPLALTSAPLAWPRSLLLCSQGEARWDHTNTLARASAPALAISALLGWQATAWMASSCFLRWAVISCTHVLLSRLHKRREQSWPAQAWSR